MVSSSLDMCHIANMRQPIGNVKKNLGIKAELKG
jgi:hypothetical protein